MRPARVCAGGACSRRRVRRAVFATVGTALACLPNEGKRIATIRLHLGVHSLGVARPRGGRNPPRRPPYMTTKEVRRSPDVSGLVNGTWRHRARRGGTERHP